MRSSIGSVKRSSPGLWPAILTLATSLGFGSAMTGCIIVADHDRREASPPPDTFPPPDDTSPPPPPLEAPKQVLIEPNKALEVRAGEGEGVGLFVEYASGGHWHLWTSCDTNLSGAVCNFSAFVKVVDGAEITNLKGEELETTDVVEDLGNGTIHLSAQTSSEFDGISFDTTEGAAIELDAYLDDEPDPHIVYWFGEGVLHQGAPTNPIDFKPSAP
jgi:hypothetical protein